MPACNHVIVTACTFVDFSSMLPATFGFMKVRSKDAAQMQSQLLRLDSAMQRAKHNKQYLYSTADPGTGQQSSEMLTGKGAFLHAPVSIG